MALLVVFARKHEDSGVIHFELKNASWKNGFPQKNLGLASSRFLFSGRGAEFACRRVARPA